LSGMASQGTHHILTQTYMPEIAVWIKPKDDHPNALVQYCKAATKAKPSDIVESLTRTVPPPGDPSGFAGPSPAAAAKVELPVELALRRRRGALALPQVRRQVLRARLTVTGARLLAVRGPYVAIAWILRRLASEGDRHQDYRHQSCRHHGG
jgi:hypothetical protein